MNSTDTCLFLSLLVFLSAGACIASDHVGRPTLVYVFKPLTMVFVLALALLPGSDAPGAYRALVVAGLLFSLGGDVLLMLPANRFAAGLGSFLVAHLLYIGAFAPGAGLSHPGLLALYGCAALAVVALLWPKLGGLKLPVLVYVAAIAVMAWQAGARWLGLGGAGALFAFAGASLFVVSDAALALNRFRRPFANAQLVVLGTYFTAQWMISLSIGAGEALLAGGIE